jgi:hypothetical protein
MLLVSSLESFRQNDIGVSITMSFLGVLGIVLSLESVLSLTEEVQLAEDGAHSIPDEQEKGRGWWACAAALSL